MTDGDSKKKQETTIAESIRCRSGPAGSNPGSYTYSRNICNTNKLPLSSLLNHSVTYFHYLSNGYYKTLVFESLNEMACLKCLEQCLAHPITTSVYTFAIITMSNSTVTRSSHCQCCLPLKIDPAQVQILLQ